MLSDTALGLFIKGPCISHYDLILTTSKILQVKILGPREVSRVAESQEAKRGTGPALSDFQSYPTAFEVM